MAKGCEQEVAPNQPRFQQAVGLGNADPRFLELSADFLASSSKGLMMKFYCSDTVLKVTDYIATPTDNSPRALLDAVAESQPMTRLAFAQVPGIVPYPNQSTGPTRTCNRRRITADWARLAGSDARKLPSG